jgi:hypothetical protein
MPSGLLVNIIEREHLINIQIPSFILEEHSLNKSHYDFVPIKIERELFVKGQVPSLIMEKLNFKKGH